MAVGRQLAAEFQRDTKPLESLAALAYIDGIGQRLAAQIGGPPFTCTFALVADDPTVLHEVAAFPGGFLFVPASLILAVKDEDELAGMLAHARGEFRSPYFRPPVHFGASPIWLTGPAPRAARSPAKLRSLCRAAGGELEQIQFLLGHVSVQTTERYLGCAQRISSAVNDRIGIEPKA